MTDHTSPQPESPTDPTRDPEEDAFAPPSSGHHHHHEHPQKPQEPPSKDPV
ncbi:hypothetical protein BSIN_0428 [Burkholderia singularis]|uniref:Uncharacterized protein n=1 Tax=Burkholderia singularis TaxID=1503053 RepID=A0A238H6D4_9BURK|nr:hypothetical protein BSIN_0428 [Burkholderia singularis]